MCLIINKPAGAEVPRWIVDSAQEWNRDGVGIMSAGRTEKWLRIGAGKLLNHVHKLGDAAIHFRMATHGDVTHDNVHPFKIANGGYLMHNGVLSRYAPIKNSALSDTACFVREYVNPMLAKRGELDLAAVARESSGSALAIMQGSRIDLTGGSWVEHEGLKLSNTYAWDAPAHLVSKYSHDIHGDDDADGATANDSEYWRHEMRQHDYIDGDELHDTDRAAELEADVIDELLTRVDEIDFGDSRLLQCADSKTLTQVLGGTLPPEQFIKWADASALLEMRLQIERRCK